MDAPPAEAGDATPGSSRANARKPGNAETRRTLGRWTLWTIFALLALRTLAVDVFPIITNDSLAYLGHSNSLAETGFVQFGYRQVGYPLFLAVIDAVGTAFRLEPLLLSAFAQRVLLIAGLAYATWLWRFWALPLVFVITTPTLVAYTNLILTEGAGLPLAVIYACLVGHAIRLSRRAEPDRANHFILATAMAGIVFLALVAIRFHYIVTAAGVAACLWVVWSRGSRRDHRIGAIVAAVLVLGGAALLGLQSLENYRELGVAFPSARGERGLYWATWTTTFRDEENRSNPLIADLYADGDAYAFIRQTESGLPEYEAQREAFTNAVERLVTSSGSSMWAARVDSFTGVLSGGRIDDIAGIVKSAARTSRETVEGSIYRTSWIDQNGRDAFFDQFNNGRAVEAVISSPIALIRSAPYFVTFFRVLGPLALVLLAVGMLFAESRLLAAVGLTTLIGTAAVMGYFLLDNVRFVAVPLAFTFTITTGTAAAFGSQLGRPLAVRLGREGWNTRETAGDPTT